MLPIFKLKGERIEIIISFKNNMGLIENVAD
jgi:hypothetical protein